MKRWLLPLFLFLALAGPSRAQFVGYTSPQTVTIKVFSGQNTAAVTPNNSAAPCVATNGNPCAVQNLGQNMHFLSYTLTGSPSVFDLRMEGSNDGVTFFSISDDAIDTVAPAGVLFAAGYYPFIRVNLVAIFPGTASVTANYSGTSAVSSPPVGVYTTGLQTRKVVFSRVSMGASINSVFSTPTGSTSGYIVLGPTQGLFPGGSAISITSVLGNQTFNTVLSAALPSSFIVFPVSGVPATSVSIAYTSGGASANDFSMWYVFSAPYPTVDPCLSPAVLKSSAVITAPAATTTQIVGGLSGQSIYACGYQLGVVTAATGTFQWTTGTGGTCAANTVTKTGAIPINTALPVSYGPGSTIFSAAAGSGVCLTLTGAGDNAAGILTYVQQ